MLAAVESSARGILISVFPIMMYRTLGDAETVSEVYLLIGILSFFGRFDHTVGGAFHTEEMAVYDRYARDDVRRVIFSVWGRLVRRCRIGADDGCYGCRYCMFQRVCDGLH